MTQPSDHPGDQSSPGAAPPPAAGQPYPSAPPISEPYGAAAVPSGVPGELAGRWARLFAAILDGILVSIISWILIAPLVGGSAMYGSGGSIGKRFVANIITAVIAIIYFTLQHGKWGQSIGKRALGIRVVRVDGGPIGYGPAFGRVAFTYVLNIITFGIGSLVDVIWILWDSRKQALHDKVVKSVVVKADAVNPYAGA
jgi:uncharacterized RDD family membrane protein YckC